MIPSGTLDGLHTSLFLSPDLQSSQDRPPGVVCPSSREVAYATPHHANGSARFPELIRLGPDYVVVDRRREWAARELLTWLEHQHPARLDLPTSLRLPDIQQEGAIGQLARERGLSRPLSP
jgi:hypothetical protein